MVIKQTAFGCGFVDCPDVESQHGKQAYIHSSVMGQCQLCEGNLICFKVHVSSSGNPQVSAPCWICCSEPELLERTGAKAQALEAGEEQLLEYGEEESFDASAVAPPPGLRHLGHVE